MCLAGGLVQRCLCGGDDDGTAKAGRCDVDLFVYGRTETARVEAYRAAIHALAALRDTRVFVLESAVTTVYVADSRVHALQVICTSARTPLEVVHEFDYDYVQALYAGGRVYATPACVRALQTRTASLTMHGGTSASRIGKALQKRFAVRVDTLPAVLRAGCDQYRDLNPYADQEAVARIALQYVRRNDSHAQYEPRLRKAHPSATLITRCMDTLLMRHRYVTISRAHPYFGGGVDLGARNVISLRADSDSVALLRCLRLSAPVARTAQSVLRREFRFACDPHTADALQFCLRLSRVTLLLCEQKVADAQKQRYRVYCGLDTQRHADAIRVLGALHARVAAMPRVSADPSVAPQAQSQWFGQYTRRDTHEPHWQLCARVSTRSAVFRDWLSGEPLHEPFAPLRVYHADVTLMLSRDAVWQTRYTCGVTVCVTRADVYPPPPMRTQ